MYVHIQVLSCTCIQYVCQLIFRGDILDYCVHCTLHVGCCSKSLSESSGSEVYTDPLLRLGSKRSYSERGMGESSHATVEGMLMCARSLAVYHVCIGGTFMPYGYVQCDVCILLTTMYITLYITMYVTLYMTLYNTTPCTYVYRPIHRTLRHTVHHIVQHNLHLIWCYYEYHYHRELIHPPSS